MKNNFIVIVKGFVLNDGKILIVQRSQSEKVGRGTWECPGGKVEFGETLETSLNREMKEETGLEVEVKDIIYASTFFNTDPAKQFVILTYLCKTEDTAVSLSKEHSDYRWVTKDQAKLLLAANIIRDFHQYNVFSIEKWQ